MIINPTQLASLIAPKKYAAEKLQKITDALNATTQKYTIDSPLRTCHFLAQVLHESGAFQFSVEIWGNTAAQKAYDTRTDLGNTPELDGDGYKYRGRGWIQVTGKANYRAVSVELGKDFVTNPDLLGTEPWDGLSAGWYWNKKKLNTWADQDDLLTITKKVNGGYNGLNERKMWLLRAKEIFK